MNNRNKKEIVFDDPDERKNTLRNDMEDAVISFVYASISVPILKAIDRGAQESLGPDLYDLDMVIPVFASLWYWEGSKNKSFRGKVAASLVLIGKTSFDIVDFYHNGNVKGLYCDVIAPSIIIGMNYIAERFKREKHDPAQ